MPFIGLCSGDAMNLWCGMHRPVRALSRGRHMIATKRLVLTKMIAWCDMPFATATTTRFPTISSCPFSRYPVTDNVQPPGPLKLSPPLPPSPLPPSSSTTTTATTTTTTAIKYQGLNIACKMYCFYLGRFGCLCMTIHTTFKLSIIPMCTPYVWRKYTGFIPGFRWRKR